MMGVIKRWRLVLFGHGEINAALAMPFFTYILPGFRWKLNPFRGSSRCFPLPIHISAPKTVLNFDINQQELYDYHVQAEGNALYVRTLDLIILILSHTGIELLGIRHKYTCHLTGFQTLSCHRFITL